MLNFDRLPAPGVARELLLLEHSDLDRSAHSAGSARAGSPAPVIAGFSACHFVLLANIDALR